MSHTAPACVRFAKRVALLLGILTLTGAAGAGARMAAPTSVARMAASAARVFRGRCTVVTVGMVEVAGARVPATTYTFRVREHLKGGRRSTITFQQLGTPAGGPRDLGRLAELPVYVRGTEYVLFLLPASAAGLTSPAGAAEGAFLVRDQQVVSVRGAGRASASAPGARARPAPDLETSSYEELRRVVRAAVVR